ncbi:MAG: peptide-methionine (S)-S-oxide reductase MsrA [Candidatus Doudnabacteria bacterium]|nr:peptide-methionine (S)-S-oxide reductase MsrA [Candidatus Doudnabacteria bacterium]
MRNGLQIAIFGGGCFWCTEAVFQNLKGVEGVTSGYAGGNTANPSYEEVSSGRTGHAEVIKIEFDPSQISYRELLEVFFATHDPTTPNRQGGDVGEQYRSIIFYTNSMQKREAEKFIEELANNDTFDAPILTQLQLFDKFYEAEDYHKNYYLKNPDKPYCQTVISPKLAKMRQKFARLCRI